MANWYNLINDILIEISYYLSPSQILKLKRVNKKTADAMKHDSVWRDKISRMLPFSVSSELNEKTFFTLSKGLTHLQLDLLFFVATNNINEFNDYSKNIEDQFTQQFGYSPSLYTTFYQEKETKEKLEKPITLTEELKTQIKIAFISSIQYGHAIILDRLLKNFDHIYFQQESLRTILFRQYQYLYLDSFLGSYLKEHTAKILVENKHPIIAIFSTHGLQIAAAQEMNFGLMLYLYQHFKMKFFVGSTHLFKLIIREISSKAKAKHYNENKQLFLDFLKKIVELSNVEQIQSIKNYFSPERWKRDTLEVEEPTHMTTLLDEINLYFNNENSKQMQTSPSNFRLY